MNETRSEPNLQPIDLEGHLARLRREHKQLEQVIADAEKQMRELLQQNGDGSHKALDWEDWELLFRRSTQFRQRLHMVIQGLKRIQDGSFGRCIGCNANIEEKRLRAIPSARYCIECQKKVERHQIG